MRGMTCQWLFQDDAQGGRSFVRTEWTRADSMMAGAETDPRVHVLHRERELIAAEPAHAA